ncbi:type IV toxin-antitoxin system AbiEi family antitoxin domain-containing protein [Desertimonas flava]|uniref:type IV toxin-antitoxin system AbiEi family antitoxin domain-containing protein n=1 Tax=Desertimonas flava TaxID=2064846 RepID=UPI000E349745|nr:type IV toxin-antitoxin system AbiEi family antitoxin domain-containing protein [Desertimonas flava]
MRREERIERLRSIRPVFRAAEAREAGLSWRDLYELRDAGDLIALSRGIYQLSERAGGEAIDFVTVSYRAPSGMICLDSALAYWDLTDHVPAHVHLAVRKGTTRPMIDHPPTAVHVFNDRTFDVGRVRVDVDDDEGFWITDRERTIVDAHRLRHQVGADAAAHALRRYLRRRDAQLPLLLEYARALGTDRSLVADLQLLMA